MHGTFGTLMLPVTVLGPALPFYAGMWWFTIRKPGKGK